MLNGNIWKLELNQCYGHHSYIGLDNRVTAQGHVSSVCDCTCEKIEVRT